jgi:hypothetical protein
MTILARQIVLLTDNDVLTRRLSRLRRYRSAVGRHSTRAAV